ncbi:snake venom serine proteinase 9-like [Convolutriloba macropyga]|uniref:snake venom serine proteinase 9-like n=1 Tax=Convolutriloba macropyga TaxID=536237 RepID=UPI003F525A34
MYLSFVFFLVTLICSTFSINHDRLCSNKNLEVKDFLPKLPGLNLIISGRVSPPRPFYARIHVANVFCGASILSDQFLITASKCVSVLLFMRPVDLYIEVEDFTNPDSPKTRYEIHNFFVTEHNNFPQENLALIRTRIPIENWNYYKIDLCSEPISSEDMSHIPLGACGMGSISKDRNSQLQPAKLKEMLFYQSVLEVVDPLGVVPCDEHTICTVPFVEGGNICSRDEGGPLYRLNCSTMLPECLYGVASYHKNKENSDEVCNGGSYFTSIDFYRHWIYSKLILHA